MYLFPITAKGGSCYLFSNHLKVTQNIEYPNTHQSQLHYAFRIIDISVQENLSLFLLIPD